MRGSRESCARAFRSACEGWFRRSCEARWRRFWRAHSGRGDSATGGSRVPEVFSLLVPVSEQALEGLEALGERWRA